VLSEIERNELEHLVRAHSNPQQLVLRAQIILLAADGLATGKARADWELRFIRCDAGGGAGAASLIWRWSTNWPMRRIQGRRRLSPPEQIRAILACEPSEANGIPITH
jgi:hypothetical protein